MNQNEFDENNPFYPNVFPRIWLLFLFTIGVFVLENILILVIWAVIYSLKYYLNPFTREVFGNKYIIPELILLLVLINKIFIN